MSAYHTTEEDEAEAAINDDESDVISSKHDETSAIEDELNAIRSEMRRIRLALDDTMHENLELKNQVVQLQSNRKDSSNPKIDLKQLPKPVNTQKALPRVEYTKSINEIGNVATSRPARRLSPQRARRAQQSPRTAATAAARATTAAAGAADTAVIYLEDDFAAVDYHEQHQQQFNRRYAERPDARSSLSMIDLCGDDSNYNRRFRKSPPKNTQCSSSNISSLLHDPQVEDHNNNSAALVVTKSLADLGGSSKYVSSRKLTEKPVQRSESLSHLLLHSQQDCIYQQQQHQQQVADSSNSSVSSSSSNTFTRAMRNAPFANEVTSAQYLAFYEPLEQQLTQFIAERNSITDESERLRARGLRTLRERGRVQFIDIRLQELQADICCIRNALTQKPI